MKKEIILVLILSLFGLPLALAQECSINSMTSSVYFPYGGSVETANVDKAGFCSTTIVSYPGWINSVVDNGYAFSISATANTGAARSGYLSFYYGNSPYSISLNQAGAPAPAITQHPTNQSKCENATATFSISASNATSYQWWESTNGGSNYVPITGATSSTYSFTAASSLNNFLYRCVASNGAGTATSNSALLTVSAATQVGYPQDVTVCPGASSAVFEVGAAGSNLTFHWYRSINGGGFVALTSEPGFSGIYSPQLTVTDIMGNENAQFKCDVSGLCPGGGLSDAATLYVTPTSITVSDPSDQSICPGTQAQFSVNASGQNLTFQWEESTNISSDFQPIPGASNATYTFTPGSEKAGYKYQCLISGDCGASETSNPATLTFLSSPQITVQPQSKEVCPSSPATFSLTAINATQYTWQHQTPGSSVWINSSAAGANTNSVTAESIDNIKYRCIVGGTCAPNDTSDVVTLSFLEAAQIVTHPADVTVCSNSEPVTFTAQGVGSNLVYQWERSENGGAFVMLIAGNGFGSVDGPVLEVADISGNANARFRCVVSGCGSSTSDFATLSLASTAVSVSNPTDEIICPGDQATFTVVGSGENVAYQWYESSGTSEEFAEIPNATSNTYGFTPTLVKSGYRYQCSVNGNCGASATSEPATLQFHNVSISISEQPEDVVGCEAEMVQLDITFSGAGLLNQWELSVDGGSTFSEIVGMTNPSYSFTTSSSMDGYRYRCKIRHQLCNTFLYSDTVMLTVLPNPVIQATVESSATSVSIGEDIFLSVHPASPSFPVTWRWYVRENGDSITIAMDSVIKVNPLSTITYYVNANACKENSKSVTIDAIEKFSGDRNYIYTATPKIAMDGTMATATEQSLVEEISYFDGLGREEQNIGIRASFLGKDFVQPIVYDDLGRKTLAYLPYTSVEANGAYKIDPTGIDNGYGTSPHYTFYHQNGDKVSNDDAPYAKTILDGSPMNRVVEQASAGVEWQPDTINSYSSADRTVKKAYEANGPDEVLMWFFQYPVDESALGLPSATSAESPSGPAYFPEGHLYKYRTKDEEYHEVVEYLDKEGRTILKSVGIDSAEYAHTYYVYDDFDNFVCVLPPQAVKHILETPSQFFGKSDQEKEDFLKRWAFRYRYDGRKRMTIKQVPGASPVYMVYDNRDRLVLTQDGNQRTTSPYFWTFTKYDEFNRAVLTGLKDTAAMLQQSEMQAVVDAHYAKPGAQWGEKYIDGEAIHGYTNATYPLFTSGALSDPNHYLTVTYYDDYDFRDQWLDAYSYTDDGLSLLVNDILYEQPDLESLRVKGQVTGSKVKVLDGGTRGRYTWLKSVNYYDDRYRLIQSIADNYKGGQDRVTMLYDFTGRVLKSKTHHTTNEISWTGLLNTVVTGNNLVKTALGAGWTAGGVTIEQLPAGEDGWIECIITEPDQKRAFGLTEENEGEHRNTIDYAFWHDATAAAIFENGSLKYTLPDLVKSGDVIRIERSGTTIKYYKNGLLLYTSATPSSTVLIGDASIDSGSGNILVPRASFNSRADSLMRRFTYDHAGRLTEVWHQVNAAPEVRITYNEYNELGQLVDKKLHSTDVTASDAHQSVDYRYNIRGWLTGMNENNLANGDGGGPQDYFSFQLAYNDDAGIGNTPMYNGNISGMKWSTNLGLGDEKMNAYTYAYDKLNRITDATFKRGSGSPGALSWTTPVDRSFSAGDYTYDLNGNLLTLNRKGKEGSDLDILTYEYGTGSAQSNRLLKVTDAGSQTEGFTEKISEGDDYVYDNNGNLVWDKNKGGEEVLVNGDFASGSANWVVTDPGGRLTFAEDSLKITAHASESAQLRQNDIILRRAAYVVIVDMVREAGAITINVGSGGNTSINTSGKTVLTCRSVSGDDFVVNIPKTFSGRINSIEVKGIVVIDYNYLNLPAYISKGPQQQLGYIYDAGGRKISQEVYAEDGAITKKSDYEGEFFYENDTLRFISHEEGRVVMADSLPEYQYHLKDHLGNVRLTFTTKPDQEESLATLETANENDEQAEFLYYDEAIKVNYDLFDHTYEGTTGPTYYSTRLTGGNTNAIYGLAKSLSVMPGDTVNMEVFAKYLDPDSENWTTAMTGFMSAVSGGTAPPGTVIDGGSPGSVGGGSFPFSGFFDRSSETGEAPKAYLNFIVFDRNFEPIIGESGYIRITTASKENGDNVTHDKLERSSPLVIKQAGYVYIYLSNENDTPVEVFFDDFRVEHIKSPVVQMDDYYPFGLTFNSYQRENSVDQKYLYNGKEIQDELQLGWLDYGARMLDPSLGRWFVVDNLADHPNQLSWTPYHYVKNSPTNSVDPDGNCGDCLIDLAFIAYDLSEIAYDYVTKGEVDPVSVAALSADVAALAIPVVTGAGLVVRLGKEGGEVVAKQIAKEGAEKVVKEGAEKTTKEGAQKATHGNKLDNKPAEGYSLNDKKTGEVKKYGETTRGEDKFGAGNQKRYTKKELDEKGVDYNKQESGTKKDMHHWQHEKIVDYNNRNGKRPDLNKSFY